jgi:hypothetical protein
MTISINIGSLPLIAPATKGDVSPVLKHFRGIVTEKNDLGDKFVSYKITDNFNTSETFKVISSQRDYLSLDNMSFSEMHEDVEVGDNVSVFGHAAMSKKGSFYIRATGILVREYGNNKYESVEEDSQSESDPEYIPSESEQEDEQEDLEESEVDNREDPEYLPSESEQEEELEETDHESSDSEEEEDEEVVINDDYQPSPEDLSELRFVIPKIPLKVYNQFIEYQGRYFTIGHIRTDIPFRITLVTKLGNFHISKMGKNTIGVYVPGNGLEASCPNGYDMILQGKFRELLKVLE